MTRPCKCDNYLQGEPYVLGRDCRLCWLFHSHDGYNRSWGGPGVKRRCLNLGLATGERVECVECTAKGNKVQLKLYACKAHGTCTLGKRVPGHGCCDSCAEYDPQFVEWTSLERLGADTRVLAGLVPHDACGVAGVPRSGMIPASMLATLLHVPLYELTEWGRLTGLGAGSRGPSLARNTGPLIVVDDTVFSGAAMSKARAVIASMNRRGFFVAPYTTPEAAHVLDAYAKIMPAPHVLEWNMWNNGVLNGVATDFDGILCLDPDVPDADAGEGLERYRQWMTRAKPQWLPRRNPVPLIVTARLEQFRPETESWLAKHGVKWNKLVMHPAGCASARGDVAAWKAARYRESGLHFFIESDAAQAEAIHAHTGMCVVCPGAGRVWQ